MNQNVNLPVNKVVLQCVIVLSMFVLLSAPPLLAFVGLINAEYQWYHLYPVPVAIMWCAWYWLRFPEHRPELWCNKSLASYGAIFVGVSVGSLTLMLYTWHQIDFQFPLEIFVVGIVISFFQELLFREYLVRFLRHVGVGKMIIVLVSGLTFALIHLFFPGEHMWLILLATFAYGSWLAWVYYTHPRLLLAWATHAPANILLTSTSVFW